MISVGIDPGKRGAIAILPRMGVIVKPMPLVKARVVRGKKRGRDEYDLPAIREILKSLGDRDVFVTVEKSQPMPPKIAGGSITNFNRGVARGFEWMLVGLCIPYQLVAPRTWQSEMHKGIPEGDTKQRSIMAAKRLFGVSLKRTERSRKDDDGIAEALLLAAYGLRTQGVRRVL